MTQVALNISRAGYEEVAPAFSGFFSRPKTAAPTREVIILGVILALLQVCDGVLTGIGISNFGTSAEGNSFLRLLMEHIGTLPALMLVKSLAITVTVILCSLSNSVKWIRHALKAVIGVYLIAAVVPWTMILINQAI